MFAGQGSSFAHFPSVGVGRQNQMLQPQFLSSNTFRWASAVAGLFATFVIVLFGFIYLNIDDYLIARSDRMIEAQIEFLSSLPFPRSADVIADHLRQDSRGVQFAGVFDPSGRRLAGNLEQLPHDIKIDAPAQTVHVLRPSGGRANDPAIRAMARRLENGNVVLVGRNVDETWEISHVVGEALALGLLPAFCLCLAAGAWLSVRAQRRVEEVNQRVQRIVAGDLHERLPHRDVDEPFSRLAAIVNGMLNEMETMINALSGVGNDIAHELRTPLTRARLTLERGRSNATSLEQLQKCADKAIAGIDQSLAIVMALLRLTDIETSRRSAAFGIVALHDLVREVGDIYEPIAEDKQITLNISIETNADVCGDRDLLFEAIINLVDNAVKFTPEGGRVEIELVQAEKGALVRVTDTGPGISRQETEIVLRRFYRSDKTRHAPGVGLGLNLVAAIVKLHGFRLLIHPGPGGRIEIVCAKHDAPRSSTRLALSA
jgi:signal transduction histidine kinase